jgi:hypothetical protein
MLVGSWIVESCRYPLFDDINLISFFEQWHNDEGFDWNNVLCVNVSYDKTMVQVVDDFGDTVGRTSITDRDSLLKFLRIIEGADYKEVFIDVRFPKYIEGSTQYTLKSEPITTATLFSQIKKMRNTLVANHAGMEIEDSSLLAKSAIADYGVTIFTGFARYEYLQDAGQSVALRMYMDIDKRSLRSFGFLACDGWHLCRNAQFVHVPKDVVSAQRIENEVEVQNYPLLSSQIFRYNTPDEIQKIVNGKVVLIGDFDNDMHTTYAGNVPGPILNYLAYKELHEGRHLMGWFEIVRLFFFACILYVILVPNNLIKGTFHRINIMKHFFGKWPLIRFLLSFLGISFLIACFKIFVAWWWFGISMSVFVPSLMLTIINEIHRYKSEYSPIKQ